MPKGAKFGGRVAGTPNKATADVKALAQVHGPAAVALLFRLMTHSKTAAQARIAAARELLDRGYGKAPQALTGAGGADLIPKTIQHIHEHRESGTD